MTEEEEIGSLLAAEYDIINQMLAELDKEIRSRFGDICLDQNGVARVSRLWQYCRGELRLDELPEDERENAQLGKKMWVEGGGTEVDLLLMSRSIMLFEAIHRRHIGDPTSELFEQDIAKRYLYNVSEKYKALIRKANGEVMVEDTPKIKRERAREGVFVQMKKVLGGKSAPSESEAARRVWSVSMRHLFKNAKTLRSQYNTWKNSKLRRR